MATDSVQNALAIIEAIKGGIERELCIRSPVSISLVPSLPGGILGGYAWQGGKHCIYLIHGGNVTHRLAHEYRHAYQRERGLPFCETDAEQWAQGYVVSL